MIRKLLLSAAALAMLPSAANATWYQASSKHFVVYSNDTPERVKAYTEKLERFDKAISVWHVTKEVDRGPASRVTIFVLEGAVSWPQTLVMLSGALFGGYLGGYLVRILPATIVRWFVIVTGAVMAVVYAVKYWL